MFSEVRKRSKKAGQPPGTFIYTGDEKSVVPSITVMSYSVDNFYEMKGHTLQECLPNPPLPGATTWINVEGLHDISLVENIAATYQLHPLTVEDILNVEQRSKVDEFDEYLFVTLKILNWKKAKKKFYIDELSLIIKENLIITFLESESDLFTSLRDRLHHSQHQSIRKYSSDYLAYRIIDAVVDNYFLVLEGLGDEIERIEDNIISNPSKKSARSLYKMKRQILQLRKIIWPIREVVGHLLKVDGSLISSYTHVYFRDVYDHTMQAFDTVETFREMLSNLLDVYLSSLTNKMNEVMKVLTIIATTFIPVTFLASIYGMNFTYMPELNWHYSYPVVLLIMASSISLMLYYFRRKKWW